jgi:hypothetical protein
MRAAIIAASILALGACNADADTRQEENGSGKTGQRSFDVAGFDRVSLGGAHDVVVKVGGAHSVRAEGDTKALERLDIRVVGGELKIGSKRDKDSWSIGFGGRHKGVTVHVTLPSLTGAEIGGSGDLKIDRVEGSGFAASIAGSGDIDVAALKVGEASFSIAGSGGITAKGSADKTSISIAGSGDVDLAGLESRNASVSVVGSGNVSARVNETADVSVMGSGDVTLAGSAKCKISKMGSGEVRCEG